MTKISAGAWRMTLPESTERACETKRPKGSWQLPSKKAGET
jgi:hypothetical protein